jgi:hypothetical protein
MITDPSGNPLRRRELLRRIGRLVQVAGIEPFVLDDGPARGVRACRFRTGSGLSFDVVSDHGMDLGFAEHRGTPLTWLSPNGVVAPSFHEPEAAPRTLSLKHEALGGLKAISRPPSLSR